MENPLVSLVVITYNSSKYVIELLESIKSQTYENIELIISDDCSIDETITICNKWLEMNSFRFVNSKIITHSVNTGISANCNRGIIASYGKWLMVIGADDALLPDCVDNNIEFIKDNSGARVVHSQSYRYLEEFNQENLIGIRDFTKLAITHPDITPEDQYQILLRGSKVNATTFFIQRSLLNDFGLFDESIPMVDDWPFWLKITAAGIKIHFFNKVTAKYRIREDSICNENFEGRLSNNHHLRTRGIYVKYILPNVKPIERFFINYRFIIIVFCQKAGLNSKNLFAHLIYWILARPYTLYLSWKENKIEKNIRKQLNKS
jgi:glycosyltransferase involved in cell wall biosynthesis